MLKIKTDHKLAIDSPDFLVQQQKNLKLSFSAAEDNSTNKHFISKIEKFFSSKKNLTNGEFLIDVLDLGCGGGQLIVDFSEEMFIKHAIGLDGVAGSLGRKNWLKHKNKFFNVDLSKDFTILNEKDEIQKFDLITSWEMIEHLHPNDLNLFFKNMYKHLKDDGVFLGSIALFPDVRDAFGRHQAMRDYDKTTEQFVLHQSVFCEEYWKNNILKDYKVCEYPFRDDNYKCGYLAVRDHPKDEKGDGGSFYLMITK